MSRGEKQRICIARTILKDPAILIWDEAERGLDAESGEVVREFERILEGKTWIIFAKEIEMVKDADDIIVFENERVVKRGNYQQLIGI